ncbi:MAG: Ig-like domain-containing protein, partial [Actinomycetia bacterium]|nr:Ig-like domain-containing protein [Actinomycetes bacterium]
DPFRQTHIAGDTRNPLAGQSDAELAALIARFNLDLTVAELRTRATTPTVALTCALCGQPHTHDAPLNATLAITLSEAISETSVTTQTVFVHGGGHGHMDGAITFGSILYDPTADFFPGELVQTSVTTDVLDSGGAPLTAPYVWSFRAAAGIGPATFTETLGLGSADSIGVSLGDVDGDGDLDAFVANGGSQPNTVWLNDGGLQGGTPGAFTDSGQSLGSSDSFAVSLGDVDGDGDLDVFVANWQPNQVWLNAGGLQGGTPGAFTDSGQTLGSADSVGVSLGDVDGDGDL